MKRVIFAITVVAAAFAATTFATSPVNHAETSSQGRAVADWSLIAQNAIVVAGRRFPGEAAVFMGIVHATIYDVVVAIEGGYRPYAITPTVPPNTSLEAAVATAAHRVLADVSVSSKPPWKCLQRLSGWDTGRGGESQWYRGW